MRRARATLLATIAVLTPSHQARAQWQVNGDVGLSHLRQNGVPESVAQTLGATIDGLGDRAWFHGTTLSSLQASAAWTGQALALGGFSGRIANPLRWEIGGALSGFTETGAPSTTSAEANARLRFGGAFGGIAIGGAAGASERTSDNLTLTRGSIDTWWSAGDERLLASALLTRAGSLSYTDVGVGWRHDATSASIGASVGLRSGAGNGSWQVGDAQLWVAPRFAIVLAAGSVLPDLARGTPSARYVSIGLRAAWQPHIPLRFGRANKGVRFLVARGANGLARITLSVPQDSVSRVELMGDFTAWTPVALQRGGDGWYTELAVAAGPHRIMIRIDDGDWAAPSNAPSIRDDDLGGTVGLITVP